MNFATIRRRYTWPIPCWSPIVHGSEDLNGSRVDDRDIDFSLLAVEAVSRQRPAWHANPRQLMKLTFPLFRSYIDPTILIFPFFSRSARIELLLRTTSMV